MAKVSESQIKVVDSYEKTLESWLGDVSEEHVAKILDLVGKVDGIPFSRSMRLYLDLCAHCGACANECHIYRTYPRKEFNPAYRAKLLRAVYLRHFTPHGKIFRGLMGARKLDRQMVKEWFIRFYQCTMCRRCNIFCPFGVDNMRIASVGRSFISAVLGKTTPDMKRGADLHLEIGNAAGIKEAAFRNIVGFWEEEIKEKKGWEVKIPIDNIGAEIYLIPVNTDFALSLDGIEGVVATLYATKADWTISSKVFDVVNYGLFFAPPVMTKIMNMHIEEAKRLKCKTLVVGECGHALRVLSLFAPAALGVLPFEVKSILQVTADYVKQGKIRLNKEANPEPVTYHDPCKTSRMCGVIEEPRIILKAACKDFREMVPNRDRNYCCGGGGGMVLETASHDYRMEITGRMKVDQIKQTGAKFVALTCANCFVQIGNLIEYYKLDARQVNVHGLVLNALEL